MRDAKRLVQIEMADVGAVISRSRQPNLGVEIGAIEINLATESMHDIADRPDLRLEHAVRGGIGDHDRGEIIGVLLCLGAQIRKIDVSLCVAIHHDDVHPGHVGGGRVGPVRRRWNQADVAVWMSAAAMIGTDGEQTRIFSLGAGIGLHRKGVETRDRAQLGGQIGDHFRVAGNLIGWRKRMDVGEFGPGEWNHLGGGIELHGARTERDHAPIQCQIAVRQPAHVAQHLGFRSMTMEDRMGEKAASTPQGCRQRIGRLSPHFSK